jgi:hypothetical protein
VGILLVVADWADAVVGAGAAGVGAGFGMLVRPRPAVTSGGAARGDGYAEGIADAVLLSIAMYEAAVFPLISDGVSDEEQEARRTVAYRLSAYDGLPRSVRVWAAAALEALDDGGAVPGDQPQAEGERSRGRGCRLGVAPAFEERLKRLVSQTLAALVRAELVGRRWTIPPGRSRSFSVRAQDHPVSRRPGTVGTAEQAQSQDAVDHRAGRQKPAAALGTPRQLQYLVDHFRGDLFGEYAEPDPVAELRLQPPSGASRGHWTGR